MEKIWTFIRKYSALFIAGLLGILMLIVVGRKETAPITVPTDTDNNGRDDEKEIEVITTDARTQREAASINIEAAKQAVVRPTQPIPSRNVREAVHRNNEVDY